MTYSVYGANALKIFDPKKFRSFKKAFTYAKRMSKDKRGKFSVNDGSTIIAEYRNGELVYLNRRAKKS